MIAKRNRTLLYILLTALFIVALSVFGYLAFKTIPEKENLFDGNITAYRIAHAGAELEKFLKVITFFGSTRFLFAAYIVLIGGFILKKEYRYAIAIFMVSFGAWTLSKLLKLLFQRSRPDLPLIEKQPDYSFPSGHAFSSFVFCSVLAWLIWQTDLKAGWKWLIAILLLLFTLSIGASRVVLNVHYATDVLGGFALGIMWVILAWRVWTWLESKQTAGKYIGQRPG